MQTGAQYWVLSWRRICLNQNTKHCLSLKLDIRKLKNRWIEVAHILEISLKFIIKYYFLIFIFFLGGGWMHWRWKWGPQIPGTGQFTSIDQGLVKNGFHGAWDASLISLWTVAPVAPGVLWKHIRAKEPRQDKSLLIQQIKVVLNFFLLKFVWLVNVCYSRHDFS